MEVQLKFYVWRSSYFFFQLLKEGFIGKVTRFSKQTKGHLVKFEF